MTAPVHLPACYFVGRVLRGESPASAWAHIVAHPSSVWSTEALLSLYLGAIVLGPVVGLVGYGVILLVWPEHLPRLRRPRRPEAAAGLPANPAPPTP